MIFPLPPDCCANQGCHQKLRNGANCGGFKAVRTQEGNHKTGYICKKCGNQSAPGTSQLRLYQQTQYYATSSYHNVTNKEIEHRRQWKNLTASFEKDEEDTNAPANGKMPEWDQVLDNMKQKKEAKAE